MKRAFSSSVFCRRSRSPVEILLIQHKRLGLWLPVGGELETRGEWPNILTETPLEAAEREVREETGFTSIVFPKIKYAPAGTPLGFLGYEEHNAGDKGLHMNFCFLADVPPDATPVSDGSWDDHRWVNPYDELSDNTFKTPPNVRDLLWQILTTRTE